MGNLASYLTVCGKPKRSTAIGAAQKIGCIEKMVIAIIGESFNGPDRKAISILSSVKLRTFKFTLMPGYYAVKSLNTSTTLE
ncbi:MAG: hypothetical protein ACJAS1_004689 [Oleiphilaceae bacterium]|jgi:hypothetical protein